MRADIPPPRATFDPGFDYKRLPGLFLGEPGGGPLFIGWDTNILIDWADYGQELLFHGDGRVVASDPAHEEELVALGAFMQFWLTRDIRIRVFPVQGSDSRKTLSIARDSVRRVQLAQITAALEHVDGVEVPDAEEVDSASFPSSEIGKGTDGMIVDAAIRAGCHVLMTRDKQLLGYSPQARQVGLVLARPSEVLDELVSAGELPLSTDVVDDNHKWNHLLAASST